MYSFVSFHFPVKRLARTGPKTCDTNTALVPHSLSSSRRTYLAIHRSTFDATYSSLAKPSHHSQISIRFSCGLWR
jgi:hypothetical protein